MHSTINTVPVKYSAILTIEYTAKKTKVSTFTICNSRQFNTSQTDKHSLDYKKTYHCTSFLQAMLGHIFSDTGSLDRVFKIFTDFQASEF